MADATAVTSVDWITVVASSAVISAFVNVCWGAASKLLDRARENAKDKHRIDHVKLAVAQQLEAFAKSCHTYIEDVQEAIGRYHNHEEKAFDNIQGAFVLRFDPEPKWEELSVGFVSTVKAMPREFDYSAEWIGRAGLWAGIDDQYEFESERAAYYGLKAMRVAASVRNEIGAVGDSRLQMAAAERSFRKLIETKRKGFRVSGDDIDVLPELRAMFIQESEHWLTKPRIDTVPDVDVDLA
ncbi:hypothetical protein SAMN05443245_7616 [Paraburkholderia fungorum]|uniref:Uncharacterized protein n=1 Tax=Paraburkholderia fungorum TaxID=134537 RepID=A0A1H1JYN3_9BURK|nr:hypothetical protein [Paraburkholderia fungorum]SDR55171.1 hypothetical protein SAMN05443245_7616 [Paraburkholderia fungorum]